MELIFVCSILIMGLMTFVGALWETSVTAPLQRSRDEAEQQAKLQAEVERIACLDRMTAAEHRAALVVVERALLKARADNGCYWIPEDRAYREHMTRLVQLEQNCDNITAWRVAEKCIVQLFEKQDAERARSANEQARAAARADRQAAHIAAKYMTTTN